MQVMIITYYGKQFFKIGQGEMVLAINPVSRESKSGITARFGADIALLTTNHPDYNGVEQLAYGEREPFVIRGPGDYEVKDIFVKGILSDGPQKPKKYVNTIYSFAVDGINICFLGALSNSTISKEAGESIGEPDILFIPILGDDLIDAKAAARLASSLEPKLIIPMDYDAATLKVFLKEIGQENPDTADKLTLKRKDLEGKEGQVVVLQAV
ncbi:MAG: MBL fold metallo-hydrolase [Candidatus Pacebacteria bacterium]|nr:MBL fold metallo-hydrolase [Candidatus Paceibacterota bacterium]MBP9851454.1 MBL fold metallo-hydrolase [Candidatus Paceibacterota bacterium]